VRSRTARAAGDHGIDLPCKNCHLVIVPDDQTETGYSHLFSGLFFCDGSLMSVAEPEEQSTVRD
jgi:hypothetical protein